MKVAITSNGDNNNPDGRGQTAHITGGDKMKAKLLVDRPSWTNNHEHAQIIKAGSIVEIIKVDDFSGRCVARYKGHAVLNFTVDQAEPL